MRDHPRRGSLQFAPRVRAKRIYPNVRSVPKVEGKEIVEFAGYKVGMLQARLIEKRRNMHQGTEIITPATVIEVPPLLILGARFYEKTPYGLKTITEIWHKDVEKNKYVKRKIRNVKASKTKKEDISSFDLARYIVATQPYLAGIGKKTPEIFEITSFSQNIDDVLSKLGQQLSVSDVFAPGEFIDVISVTTGKGFQGAVKRFGVKTLSHKARKVKRKAGNLGPRHPARVLWTVPQAGQMGFHRRTEYNKWIIDVGNGEKYQRPGGWPHYGVIKSDVIVLAGSVPGPTKRLIRMRNAIRPAQENTEKPEVMEVIW